MEKSKAIRKRLVSMAVLVAVITTLLMPMTVSAATRTYQWKVLKPGVYAAESYKYVEGSPIRNTYYKITVSKAGQLLFTIPADTYITLYTSASACANLKDIGSRKTLSYNSESKSVAVGKGTYYMNVSGGKVKYAFYAATAAANYIPSKAKVLAAGKSEKIMHTPSTNFCRWYKITLTTKKKITYQCNLTDYAYSTEIYNSSMQRLETVKNGSDKKYCTKTAQAKGTYYICVRRKSRYQGEKDYAFGDVVTIKWQ